MNIVKSLDILLYHATTKSRHMFGYQDFVQGHVVKPRDQSDS